MARFFLHIKLKLPAIIPVFIIPGFLFFHPREDKEVWSKISINEVFISKKTHELFRDENSPAEFGWHITSGSVLMGRSSLYHTFFIPVKPYSPVNVILVERDIFVDDIVSSITLKKYKKKYKLNNNNDFAIIEWEKFLPDSNSGSDYSSSGASDLKNFISDSVDFQNGDYTDYYRVNRDKTLVFIKSDKSGMNITSPGDSACSVISSGNMNTKFFLAECPVTENLLRIRASVGSGKINYSLNAAEGVNRKNQMVPIIMDFIKTLSSDNFFAMDDISNLLMQIMPEESKNYCKNNTFSSKTLNIFCNDYISGAKQ